MSDDGGSISGDSGSSFGGDGGFSIGSDIGSSLGNTVNDATSGFGAPDSATPANLGSPSDSILPPGPELPPSISVDAPLPGQFIPPSINQRVNDPSRRTLPGGCLSVFGLLSFVLVVWLTTSR